MRDPASHLGQPEVEDLGVAAWADEDVGGLDVAVNDARAVRGIQRVGDFDAERQQPCPFPNRDARRCVSFSVEPSRYSMVMKERPSCSPTS